jgi:hypothetical protein
MHWLDRSEAWTAKLKRPERRGLNGSADEED